MRASSSRVFITEGGFVEAMEVAADDFGVVGWYREDDRGQKGRGVGLVGCVLAAWLWGEVPAMAVAAAHAIVAPAAAKLQEAAAPQAAGVTGAETAALLPPPLLEAPLAVATILAASPLQAEELPGRSATARSAEAWCCRGVGCASGSCRVFVGATGITKVGIRPLPLQNTPPVGTQGSWGSSCATAFDAWMMPGTGHVVSMRLAVLMLSPKQQKRGMRCPTTPLVQAPE
mmetsp:Transcript_16734/g.36198  ORF Transcript_16734/g.36198 Transcript_16734/m.36198 type:complete len:230 (+) Transcript_16734:2896-3585(+)